MSKKGMISEEVFGLIVAIVGVVVIFFVVLAFYDFYDEVGEMSGAYFGAFEIAVGIADEGKTGEFYLFDWVKSEGEEVSFYLVYFGNESMVEYLEDSRGVNFTRVGIGDNVICVCSWAKRGKCMDCLNLDLPAVYVVGGVEESGEWVLSNKLNIKREERQYVFEG